MAILSLRDSAELLNALIELKVIKDLQEAVDKKIHMDLGYSIKTCQKHFFCVVLCDRRQWMSKGSYCDDTGIKTKYQLETNEPKLSNDR